MLTRAISLTSTLLLVTVVTIGSLFPAAAYPFGASMGSGFGGVGTGKSGTGDENSRWPVQVKLEGFLHFLPAASQRPELDMVTLRISRYGETLPFALVAIEAVDMPRVTPRRLLKIVQKWQVNFDIVGPKDLLSEVAQAMPGTPLTIIGYLVPRKRTFQLTSVEGFGFNTPGSEQQAQLLLEKETSPPGAGSVEAGGQEGGQEGGQDFDEDQVLPLD